MGARGALRQVGSWDEARGKQDSKGNSRASSLLAGSLQPCQKVGGSPVLKLAVNNLEMPFVNHTKGSKLVKPTERLPLTSVSCRSSPKRLVRITYFELAS